VYKFPTILIFTQLLSLAISHLFFLTWQVHFMHFFEAMTIKYTSLNSHGFSVILSSKNRVFHDKNS
jgi:uncharacterized membrane protein YjjP (DUF1212 family)